MTTEPVPLDIRHMPELAAVVEEVQATGIPRRVIRDGMDVAIIMPVATSHRRSRSRGAARMRTALDELADGYQSVPALTTPRTLKEMTDIAAEEHAQAVAREGV
jgi:hypothetical protein